MFDADWDAAQRRKNRDINMTTERFETALTARDVEHYPFRWGIDFYHTYKQDLALMQELGLKIFRTSISWARIYPNGDDAQPNEEGIRYYVDLFTECHKRGMKVFATILHYATPVNLITKYGGWKNRRMIDFYLRYCKTLYERLGGLVDYWLPFNEINCSRFNPWNGCCLIKDVSTVAPVFSPNGTNARYGNPCLDVTVRAAFIPDSALEFLPIFSSLKCTKLSIFSGFLHSLQWFGPQKFPRYFQA